MLICGIRSGILPIQRLSKVVGFKIGEIFKSIREVIILLEWRKKGGHMRINMEIDISKLLARGTKVKKNETYHSVEFKYEIYPDFYYKYGIIGYGDKNCK